MVVVRVLGKETSRGLFDEDSASLLVVWCPHAALRICIDRAEIW